MKILHKTLLKCLYFQGMKVDFMCLLFCGFKRSSVFAKILIATSFGNSKIKEDNFRILVHLIMFKLLPVTIKFWFCFYSKIGTFFIMFLSNLLEGKVTTITVA